MNRISVEIKCSSHYDDYIKAIKSSNAEEIYYVGDQEIIWIDGSTAYLTKQSDYDECVDCVEEAMK